MKNIRRRRNELSIELRMKPLTLIRRQPELFEILVIRILIELAALKFLVFIEVLWMQVNALIIPPPFFTPIG